MAFKEMLTAARERASKAQKDAQDIVAEVKEKHGGQWPADVREKYERCLTEFNEAHQEFQSLEGKAKMEEEMQRQEAFYNQPASGAPNKQSADGPDEQQQARKKEAFWQYIRSGEKSFHDPREFHALLSSDPTLGGFHVPEDFDAEVIKGLSGFAVIRGGGARVRQTNRDTYTAPAFKLGTDPYSTTYTGAWKAQGYVTGGSAPPTQNNPLSDQERIPIHDWQPDAIEITTQLLEDAASNLDQAIAEVIAETKALDEDNAFLVGTGVGQPEGILNSGAATINSGSNSNITYPGLVDLFVGLPAQYRQNAVWIMNSVTWGEILKLEDTAGNPIIPPNTQPGTLWGKNVLFSEFLADPTTLNNKPIFFGDLRFYVIAERKGLMIKRLEERYAPNIGILPMARLGGQLVRTAAFKIQNISS